MNETHLTTQKTILKSAESVHVIEHLNEEHQDELIGFANLYLKTTADTDKKNTPTNIQQANIVELYKQGVELQINRADADPSTLFIPFPQAINDISELQNQYIALMQQADKLQGKDTIKLTKQTFDVQETYKVSDNMLRLVLSVDDSVLAYEQSPGYAYLFDLMTGNAEFDEALQREHCYYTLRKVFTEEQQDSKRCTAWVDVYLHTDKSNNELTSGGRWASALKAGHQVSSKREFPEKIEHLSEGQALLIADETSLPTVARLLELWSNPLPPVVINITNKQADQDYIHQVEPSQCAKGFTVLPMIIEHNQTDLADKIDVLLADYLANNSIQISKVWGAVEAKTTKKLRKLLRDRLDLPRANSVLKVYWRAN